MEIMLAKFELVINGKSQCSHVAIVSGYKLFENFNQSVSNEIWGKQLWIGFFSLIFFTFFIVLVCIWNRNAFFTVITGLKPMSPTIVWPQLGENWWCPIETSLVRYFLHFFHSNFFLKVAFALKWLGIAYKRWTHSWIIQIRNLLYDFLKSSTVCACFVWFCSIDKIAWITF